jgi:hypothetical protein
MQLKMGDHLTAEQVLSIRTANRRALVDSNFIELYPKSLAGERMLVGVGKDKYNVVEGRTINEKPLSREQAEDLLNQS